MGVLVEDFISAISEVGSADAKYPVIALYDTAVLLRLLGTSGKLLRTATEELNRYLQDLGFSINYFAGNEAEVAGIFDAIIFVKDSGKELEGETAAAIAEGEVSVADIRMLQNTFPERLAAMNVFPAEQLEKSAQENARYQIDEKGFSAFLLTEANAQGRAYGAQNREHDSGYLGTVMRLRKGNRTRDLLSCGVVFVTTNRFLAYASRRYLIQQKAIQPQHCPPILSVGQIATIAWLMKDQKIVPEKAGRELLCNCFAAVRPDAEWFRHFREGIEKAIAGSVEEFSGGKGNALTLQAARRIAQEESFGSTALVRALNMAEILSRASQEEERRITEQEARAAELLSGKEKDAAERIAAAEARRVHELLEAEANRAAEARAAEQRHAAALEAVKLEHADVLRREAEKAADEREAILRASIRSTAERRANAILLGLKLVITCAFGVATWNAIALQLKSETSLVLWALSIILGFISVIAFMDLLKIRIVEPVFDSARAWIVKVLDLNAAG